MKMLSAVLPALLVVTAAPLATAAQTAPATPRALVRADVTSRLRRLDADHDGRLSPAEWPARKGAARPRAFERLDADHDGYVEAGELRARAAMARADRPQRAQRRAERLAKRAAEG